MQNNLISDLDPSENNCGQLSPFGDLQQFSAGTSVMSVRDLKEQLGCFKGARERLSWEPAGTDMA